ncbi:olfactory receptor 5AP2-like [Ambystoma mexicanum]|uniref:olfactory receptor 5AP2-like n=1 Tax=Ambystoma mexicanum TaxID=8296 RepID=UPI0037E7A8B7
MDEHNQTWSSDFILMGLTMNPSLAPILFLLFFLVYIFTLFGNSGIFALIQVDPGLSSPMYHLLGNLALVDLGYSTAVGPKMLENLLSTSKTISFIGCAVQMFFFVSLAASECLLLSVMAYDRYVAICNPLLYPLIMSKQACTQLLAAVYLGGVLNGTVHTGCTFRLTFCRSRVIGHFLCDIPPLLALSCSETFLNELVIFAMGILTSIVPLLIIVTSYVFIVSAILKIRSTESRLRTFSTCTSHLACVTLYYGTIFFMYFRPSTSYSLEQDKVASIVYTVLIPLLNPLIYSLRNRDVKEALVRTMKKWVGS